MHFTNTPIVVTLIRYVENWVVHIYTQTSTIPTLTLLVEVWVDVEVWMVGVYTHCTYTDSTCRGLGCCCLHPLYLH